MSDDISPISDGISLTSDGTVVFFLFNVVLGIHNKTWCKKLIADL
jgi:hypothetical protein